MLLDDYVAAGEFHIDDVIQTEGHGDYFLRRMEWSSWAQSIALEFRSTTDPMTGFYMPAVGGIPGVYIKEVEELFNA